MPQGLLAGVYTSMIDPLVSLAFSLFNSKGAYALLVGSGISRSAGIPTGWAVVEDLCRKVAVTLGETAEPAPSAWYEKRFGTVPGYTQLLEKLGSTPEERLKLLRSYFVADEDEREQGLKVPTAAHRCIAELAAKGYFRVILTTNFDPLLESALEAAGIVPTVLSTPDAIEGALPLQHQDCVIVKVNGDYRDLRIKNTAEELSEYDPRTNALLDRIFDEYGLVVCGWSGEWDIALIRALERARSHRFGLYWTHVAPLSAGAQALAVQRRATLISIKDADFFFHSLNEKVHALEEFTRPHPLSQAMAVATTKRYLAEERHRIALRDLVMEEVDRCHTFITNPETFPVSSSGGVPFTEVKRRLDAFEAASTTLIRMLAVGTYYGEPYHRRIWADVLERLANYDPNGNDVLIRCRQHVALLLTYAAGLAALSANNYGTLASLLTEPIVSEYREARPLVLRIYPQAILDRDNANRVLHPDRKSDYHTPMSDHVRNVLQEPLREFFAREEQYDNSFDQLEYLLGLKYMDLNAEERHWMPIGRFCWHDRSHKVLDELLSAAQSQQEKWPLVRQGLFANVRRFEELVNRFRTSIAPHLHCW